MTEQLTLGTGTEDSRLHLTHDPDTEEWRAVMLLVGARAETTVDVHNAALAGWSASESRIGAPPGGLGDLMDFVTGIPGEWDDEESWVSRDGRLQLGFTHQGHDEIVMTIVLRQYHPSAWVLYGKYLITTAHLAEIAERTKRFLSTVTPVTSVS